MNFQLWEGTRISFFGDDRPLSDLLDKYRRNFHMAETESDYWNRKIAEAFHSTGKDE